MAAIAKIEFCSSNNEFFNVANTYDMCIHFQNPSSNIFIGNSNTNTFIKVGHNNITVGEHLITNNNILMNSNYNYIYTKSNTDLEIQSKKLGIGMSPLYDMDINKNVRINGNLYLNPYTSNNGEYEFQIVPGTDYTSITSSTSNNYVILQNNKGKTGICINREPYETLDIGGALRISSSNDSNYCIITHNDISFSGPIVIQKEGGYTGIGVDPLVDLHVKGDMRIENYLNSNIYVDFTTNESNISIKQWSSNMNMHIGVHGSKIGIGMDVNDEPESTLHVKGTLYVTNGTISTSDDRLKTGEVFITDAMKTLNKLRPQSYYKYGRKESGLIAQEVFYDAPELRHIVQLPSDADKNILENTRISSSYDPKMDPSYDKWGKKPAGIQYDGLIAYLIKGMQEKDHHIRLLEERIFGLEKMVFR